MLNQSDSKEALLQTNNSKVNLSQIDDKPDVSRPSPQTYKEKDDNQRSQLTYILKILNLFVGAAFLAFAIYCYQYGFDEEGIAKKAVMLRYVMPGYIGASGLMIIAIECRIGVVVRNMKFFYNYFGRGIFNIYAGVMPLTLISNLQDSLSTFQIITLVASSVMTLVGILYVCLKVCCCEKEGARIDKQREEAQDSD